MSNNTITAQTAINWTVTTSHPRGSVPARHYVTPAGHIIERLSVATVWGESRTPRTGGWLLTFPDGRTALADTLGAAKSWVTLSLEVDAPTPAAPAISADVMRYMHGAAGRACAGISGVDRDDVAHDVMVIALDRGVDLTDLKAALPASQLAGTSATTRTFLMWAFRSAQTNLIRAARERGEIPSETLAHTGTLRPSVTTHDVLAAARGRLSNAAAILVDAASVAPMRGGSGGIPATGSVLPFVDRQDRVTRVARVRDALATLATEYHETVDALDSAGLGVVSDENGNRRATVATPLIDVARIARWYAWDDATTEMAHAVTGALSPAEMRGMLRYDVEGPAGSLVSLPGTGKGMMAGATRTAEHVAQWPTRDFTETASARDDDDDAPDTCAACDAVAASATRDDYGMMMWRGMLVSPAGAHVLVGAPHGTMGPVAREDGRACR